MESADITRENGQNIKNGNESTKRKGTTRKDSKRDRKRDGERERKRELPTRIVRATRLTDEFAVH